MKKGVDYIGVGVGAMIFNSEGKVFIAKRGKKARNEAGKWDFPGGAVEFGEACEDAIIREIKEEFDMDIEINEMLGVCNHIIKKENQHWVSPSYIAYHVSGKIKIMEPDKNSEFRWVNLSEIDIESLTITSKANFKKYKQKYGFKAKYAKSKN